MTSFELADESRTLRGSAGGREINFILRARPAGRLVPPPVKVNKTSSEATSAALADALPASQKCVFERAARTGEVRCMFTDCESRSSTSSRLGGLWEKSEW